MGCNWIEREAEHNDIEFSDWSGKAAASLLARSRFVPRCFDCTVNVPVIDMTAPESFRAFRTYLDQWAGVAKRGGEFKWSADIDLEQVEYLVHAFYRIATRANAAAEARGRFYMPPEGEAFYMSLIHGVLDALESAGTPAAEFAEELRQFWPGV